METPNHTESKTPKYTTVGSVYNPQATPLQPPARRGRTIKWLPHTNLSMHRSLTSFSYRSQPYSPPGTANKLQQYSPLQQNSDRAVSPVNQGMASARYQTSPCPTTTRYGKHGGSDQTNISDEEAYDSNENLRGMSVKSLTNLASYPNPMQKNAQKLLSRARPPATAANVPAGLRAIRSDPAGVASLLQSDGASEISRSSGRDLNASSVLSTGRGAPQPLTAGPPGMRQIKSTALDHGRGYTAPDGSKPHERCDDQASARPTPLCKPLSGHVSDHAYRVDSPVVVRSVLGMQKVSPKIIDTLGADEVRQYYPRGLPTDFNTNTKPLAPNWTDRYPLDEYGRPARQAIRSIESRQAEIDAHWYSGSEMLNKTIDEAIAEKQHRDFAKFVGVIGQERKEAKGKTFNRKLTIPEAKATPASEHAKPLLSMAFQTIINHPQLNGNTDLPPFDY